jgi:hypothetical protein
MVLKWIQRAASVALFSAAALAFSSEAAFAQEFTGIQGELERMAQFTMAEKLTYARDARDEIGAALRRLEDLMKEANKANDDNARKCVTLAIQQVKALSQVAESAERRLKVLTSGGEGAPTGENLKTRADHEFRKIAVSLASTRDLVDNAEGCTSAAGREGSGFYLQVIGGIMSDLSDTVGDDLQDLDVGSDSLDWSPVF